MWQFAPSVYSSLEEMLICASTTLFHENPGYSYFPIACYYLRGVGIVYISIPFMILKVSIWSPILNSFFKFAIL